MHAPAVSHEAEARPLSTEARTLSTADSLARAVLAGFTASLTMLLTFLVAYNLARLLSTLPVPTWPGLERTSIIHPASWIADGSQAGTAAGLTGFLAAMLETVRPWLVNLAHNRLIDAGLNDVYLAAGIYILGGVLWAMLYTVVEPHLRGSPWLRGVTFAMIPALVSLVVVLPLLGWAIRPCSGAGPLPTIGNILLHAVYGAILGVVYGPMGDLDASTLLRPTDTRTGAGSFERLAAVLLVGGLLVGGLAGLAASTAGGSTAILAGEAGGGVVISGALLGAALGLFVGSFLSLSPRSH